MLPPPHLPSGKCCMCGRGGGRVMERDLIDCIWNHPSKSRVQNIRWQVTGGLILWLGIPKQNHRNHNNRTTLGLAIVSMQNTHYLIGVSLKFWGSAEQRVFSSIHIWEDWDAEALNDSIKIMRLMVAGASMQTVSPGLTKCSLFCAQLLLPWMDCWPYHELYHSSMLQGEWV